MSESSKLFANSSNLCSRTTLGEGSLLLVHLDVWVVEWSIRFVSIGKSGEHCSMGDSERLFNWRTFRIFGVSMTVFLFLMF